MPDVDIVEPLILDASLELSVYGPPARLRIGDSALGLDFSCTGKLWITDSFAAPGKLQIASTTIADPTDALAMHLGQGAVIVVWQHPAEALVANYQVQVAIASDGPHYDYPGGEPIVPRTVLRNLPLGGTVYMRVRAIGKNGTSSNWLSVKKGKRQPIEVSLAVRGISGSSIQAGAVFEEIDEPTGQMIRATCNNLLQIV